MITSYNQAEIFIPSTNETFSLPSIPGSPRVWHTLTGNVLCGGVYPGTSDSCLELTGSGDGWQPYSSTLQTYRLAHSTWDSPQGIVLLGGYYGGSSTELVTRTNTSNFFTLQDNVRCVLLIWLLFSLSIIVASYACAISDGQEVVLTGGFGNRRDVSVYSLSGFERNLADLNIGRQYHACASYIDKYSQKVKI